MNLDNSKALLDHIDKELKKELTKLKREHDKKVKAFRNEHTAAYESSVEQAKQKYKQRKKTIALQVKSSNSLRKNQMILATQNRLLEQGIDSIKSSLSNTDKIKLSKKLLSMLDYPQDASVHVCKGVKIANTTDDLDTLRVRVDIDDDRSLELSIDEILEQHKGKLMEEIKGAVSWKH